MKKCSMQKKIESLGKKSETLVFPDTVPQEVMDFIDNDADFQTICKENNVDKSNIELLLGDPEYVLSIHECSDLVDMFDEMDEIVEYLRDEGLSDSEIRSFLNLDSSIYCPGYGGVDYWEDGSVGKFNYLGLSGLLYPLKADTHCKDMITSTRKYRAFINRCKKEMADDTLALNALEAIDTPSESKKCESVSGTIKMNIDYNTFMRLLDAAAYLDADEDYKDALWDYYSEMGEIGGEALVFFDNLFQYTAWYDVDEMYDEIGERFQDESKSKEECIQDAIDDGDLTIYQYKDHYLVLN